MGKNGSVRLMEKIGVGSYAKVYKAKWNGQLVAAKQLHPILLENENGVIARDNFLDECHLLRQLRHPNIVGLLDVITEEGEEGQPPVLVTELLECDLAQLVNKSQTYPKVDTENVLNIMIDVAKGLAYLHGHENPIIHRDIAPKNILIDGENHAKIADVGLAKLLTTGRAYLSPVPGTLAYMAPETFPNDNSRMAHYGAESDIYSLGVTVLEVIIGRPPQIQQNPLADDQDSTRRNGHQGDLDEMGDDHPFRELVTRCLEEDPLDRPTASEIVQQWEDADFKREVARFDLFRSINKLQEEFLKWIPIRKRTVDELEKLNLEEIAARLDEHHRNVNIATAAGATTSIVGTGVAVAGFVLSFFTFGATIPLVIAGGVIGAAGGLTTFGSKMAEIFLTKFASKDVRAVLEEDQAACIAIRKQMSQLDDLITRNVLKILDSIGGHEEVKFHRLEEIVRLFEDMTGIAILKSNQLEPIKGGTRGLNAVLGAASSCSTAGIAGARVGTVAFDSLSAAARASHIAGFVFSVLALPFDVYFLAKSSKELINGKPSEVAEKIRSIQSRLVLPEEWQIEDIVHAYVKDKVTDVAREQGVETVDSDSAFA